MCNASGRHKPAQSKNRTIVMLSIELQLLLIINLSAKIRGSSLISFVYFDVRHIQDLHFFPPVSPEPEDQMVMEAALYRHSKTSLDGLKTKPHKKSKQIKSKLENKGHCSNLTRLIRLL